MDTKTSTQRDKVFRAGQLAQSVGKAKIMSVTFLCMSPSLFEREVDYACVGIRYMI
jgi:hypothetical protein